MSHMSKLGCILLLWTWLGAIVGTSVVEAAAVVSSSSSSSSTTRKNNPLYCMDAATTSTTTTSIGNHPNSDNDNDTHNDNDDNDNIHKECLWSKSSSSSLLDQDNFKLMRGGANSSSQTSSKSSKSSAMLEGIKNSLASALAAGVSKAVLAPFDTIKTMQQNYVATATTTGAAKSLGFLQAATMIMERPRGFLELYAGLGVAVVGSMPSVGLYFGVYSYCKRTLEPTFTNWCSSSSTTTTPSSSSSSDESPPQPQLRVSETMIRTLTIATSAAIGNTVASFSRVPYEVVKQKLQTGMYTSTFEAISTMASQEGWRAFFPMGGVSIQMLRDIPYAMVTLLSYEFLRDTFIHNHNNNNNNNSPPTNKASVWKDMAVGATAGGIGSYVTNPMDVIKTRLQTDPQLYNGQIGTCFAMTFEEGGLMAFLRGSIPRLLHKIPANGCFFVFYEFFRRVLRVDETYNSK